MKTLRNDFCVFVISHGKPENITYRQLQICNCLYPIYIVIDDKDPEINEYIRKYGEDKVLIFSKTEYTKKCDMMDNFDFDKVIVFARNACYDFAEKLGYTYFLELDDDYKQFMFRFPGKKSVDLKKSDINEVFSDYIEFYEKDERLKIFAFMQGGDFDSLFNGIGKRKAMNALFCSIKRRVIFNGRINEDINCYTRGNQLGHIFVSFPFVQICQKATQSGNGMSDTYLKFGTYTKSFYSVMQCPSFVKISVLRTSASCRIHHQILQKFGVSKILSSRYKK